MFFINSHLYNTPPHFNVYKFTTTDFPPCCDDDGANDDDDDTMEVSQYHPKAQINRDSNQDVELVMDMPGVKATDVDVQVKDKILSVSGKRLVSNSQTLQFSRQFQLDTSNVDPSTIKANLVDGVLTITAQKVKKVDNLMKIAITTNPINLVTATEEEEEEESKEDVDNEVVMVETTNDAEAS
eukprot:CAMPEP_0194211556 /NCGR_PEP_ID=MMETSP0156-20130528/10662_1 /TAXON_ID=33649 /ORGANISM="Thalassionema nitzschioides, Strain L26-B" /LENGTH=182 /DNA_ID=CAMNT_0038939147 /DNA_START=30 /DNA_END=578 /DNA_ORIENTATION=-